MISPSSSNSVKPLGIPSPLGSLPAATRVGKVRLAVSNLQASLAFYRDIIGLYGVSSATADQGTKFAQLGTADGTVILELEQLSNGRPISRRTRIGLYHTALLLPSQADLGSFINHLDQLRFPYGSSDHLVSVALYLVDPDGLTLELYADRPRAEWRYQEGLIVTGVLPLDKRALQRQAVTPWSGVPTGTTMGHVHFYVLDLTRSSEFYHRAMGLDIVMHVPGALFTSAGGYHHHVGYNVFAAGSPLAAKDDPRVLSWELVVPDDATLQSLRGRLRTAAAHADESDPSTPSFIDQDGIRVIVRAENASGAGPQHA